MIINNSLPKETCLHRLALIATTRASLPSLPPPSRHLGPGLAEIDVKPSTGMNNGLFITVERTNPINPVRNIRVLMPGFDAARAEAMPFHPRFLSTVKPFGVVRFMDYMLANGIGPKTWAERARVSDRCVHEQQYMNVRHFFILQQHLV